MARKTHHVEPDPNERLLEKIDRLIEVGYGAADDNVLLNKIDNIYNSLEVINRRLNVKINNMNFLVN